MNRIAPSICALCLLLSLPGQAGAGPASFEDVTMQTATEADMVLAYGAHPDQVGELRLPHGPGPHPVLVVIHGGCWMPAFDVAHIRPLSDALTGLGFATWTLSYRRPDGSQDGWPATFLDVARGLDELRDLAEDHALDLSDLSVLGHSAGGQLALWLAARPQLATGHPLHSDAPLPVARVLALAPITDLAAFAELDQGCSVGARQLIGGSPQDWPERYQAVSPMDNLPVSARVDLVHALDDRIVPFTQSEHFAQRFQAAGGVVELHSLAAPAGHFDVLLSYGSSWALLEALLERRR
ncbi:MAG: alpha/beta hydrolase family protein [Wenzhouxiangella sp.]